MYIYYRMSPTDVSKSLKVESTQDPVRPIVSYFRTAKLLELTS